MSVSIAALLAEVPDLAGHEARRLLLVAAKEQATWLIGEAQVDSATVERFRRLVGRRRSGEPLQYIEGSVAFGPLEIRADQRALIPRPETEGLWELAVSEMTNDPAVVVDLCTGSGNLALACKHSFPGAEVFAVDISPAAIELAQDNRDQLQLDVDFRIGDLFDALPQRLQGAVDLLVSNPPYVREGEIAVLPREIREYEPMQALVAGPRGTEVLTRIAAEGAKWLAPQGVIACEIGETQGGDCLGLFAAYDPRIERDLAGRARYVLGRAPQRRQVH